MQQVLKDKNCRRRYEDVMILVKASEILIQNKWEKELGDDQFKI